MALRRCIPHHRALFGAELGIVPVGRLQDRAQALVLRISGGDMMVDYLGYGAFARWLADRTHMRCSRVYVETQYLRRGFDNRSNFKWFPNTRSIEVPARTGRDRVEKLIFIARLDMDKGLAEALEASRHLPGIVISTSSAPACPTRISPCSRATPERPTGGVLEPAEIPGVLGEHDLLVYPSYYRSEGYPGAILEAFQCGLPVVAAKWGGVAELVEHEQSGCWWNPVPPQRSSPRSSGCWTSLVCTGGSAREQDGEGTNFGALTGMIALPPICAACAGTSPHIAPRAAMIAEGAASAVCDRDRLEKRINRMRNQSVPSCSLSGLVQYAG